MSVRAYFEECRRFWESGQKHLDAAVAAIDHGDAEDFQGRHDQLSVFLARLCRQAGLVNLVVDGVTSRAG